MKLMTNKKKALLTAAVLLALSSGEAFAETYEGVTQTVTKSNATMDELYATNKAKVTVTGSGTITFTPSGTADGEGAIDASGGSVVTIGSSSLPYDRLTANGEILAEDKSTVNLYAKEITINKGDDYAAVTATNGATITVLGHTITVGGAEDYLDEDEDNVSIHVTYNGNVNIGDDDTDTVQIPGKIILGNTVEYDPSNLIVRGNEIRIGTNGETNDIRIFESLMGSKCSIGDENTESVIMTGLLSNGGQSVLTIIGDTVTLEGNVYNFNTESFLTVYGTTISLTSDKALEEEYPYTVIAADGGVMTLGSSRTESLTIVGMVASLVEGDPGTKVSLDGSAITLQNGAVATGNGAALTIGSAGVTKTLTGDLTATDKGVVTATLSGTYTGDAVASDAGTLSLRAGAAEGNLTSTGSGSTLTADVSGAMTGTSTASDGGTLTLTSGSVAGNLTSTGSGSTLTATVSGAVVGDASAAESGNLTLTTGSLTGDLTTSDSGTLAATVSHTFTGKTTDDADTMTLTLSSGATWNLTDSSTVSTLNAEGGAISLMDGTLGETLTAGSFAGDGATLYLDADGTTNTGNDHLYVTGSHTGTTDLHLSSTSNTWEGALGTVLASVGNEEGSFVSDGETEAALHYYDLKLDSKTDNVTDGYSTDWYLKGFTKAPTNDEGHHTTVVRNLGGITGGNYLLWRSDMDTLFRRMGEADGSLTDNTDNGIWARGKGKKFSRESDFLVDSKYNEYEVGYDWLHKKTDTKEHVIGVGFAYLDGDATYVSGKGDLKGYTLGLYDTQVWKNGQYLDLSLKGSRYENEFGYTGLGRFIDGQSNSTGFSFGAEYGYKKKDEKGWFVEPQAQVVLGHFRNDAFTDSNGVHVEGESMNTALGRIGARAGYESPRFAVYAKANWYHDFGGNHVTVMSVDTDRLRVHEDYGDTWFSYGLGGAYKINDGLQAYFDLERGDGSSYDENWSWDVGLRWSF